MTKPIPPEKECNHCRQVKPIDEFPIRKSNGRPGSYCKICVTPRQQEIAQRSWAKHYGKGAPKHEARRLNYRRQQLKRDYGITLEEYEAMLAAQGGCCAICGSNNPGGGKKSKSFSVDHCHDTQRIRGLLCDRCNRGLGLLGDSVERLWAAYQYLASPNGQDELGDV